MSEQPQAPPELHGMNAEELDNFWSARGAEARQKLPSEEVKRIEEGNEQAFRLGIGSYVAYKDDPQAQRRVTNQDLWNALQRQMKKQD